MSRSLFARTLSGLAIVVVGVALLFNSVGVLKLEWLFETWWPMILVFIGLIILMSSARSWIVSAFLIILGVAYQLEELNYADFDPWQLIWPTVLILIGTGILFRGHGGSRATDDERQDITAILSGSGSVNKSTNFKSSAITAIMGGARLDLRQAKIADNAVIDTFIFWGGIEVIVPENVVLRNKVVNVMGGTDDQTTQKTDKKSSVVTVKGMAIMGGVSIRNTPSEG